MSAIGPGDWVECVRTRRTDNLVTVGRIYQVAEVRDFPWSCDGCAPGECAKTGVRLVGVKAIMPGYGSGCICSNCFRPIYRRSDKILKSVLIPVEEGVEA